MSIAKDIFQEYYESNLDAGMDEDAAADLAYEQMRDDFADRADVERTRRKENQT